MAVIDFNVVGSGDFPADMLRYDECWPASSLDAMAVMRRREEGEKLGATRRTVALRTHRPAGPTVGRWESFGWTVADIH